MNHWAPHPHVRTGDQLKFRERAADKLKMAFGTWSLLGLIIAAIIYWLRFVHDPGELHLNLALSFLASVQGVILQIAANRGDRISSEVAMSTYRNGEELLKLNGQIRDLIQQNTDLTAQVHQLVETLAVTPAPASRPAPRKAP